MRLPWHNESAGLQTFWFSTPVAVRQGGIHGEAIRSDLGGLAIFASSFAVAQEVVQEQAVVPAPEGIGSEFHRVSQILGANVRLQGEDNYGKVDDIVLDSNGTIQYLVVSKGNRYVTMPYQAANVDYGPRVVIYDVTPQAVQPLFFERNAWPTFTDPRYVTRIRQVFPRVAGRPIRGRFAPSGWPDASCHPSGGQETIKVRPNGKVKVKEKDQGLGLAQCRIPKIPFRRARGLHPRLEAMPV